MVVEEVVQKKFRVTIPAGIREKLRLREGDRVRISLESGRLIIEPSWFVEKPTEMLTSLGVPKRLVTEPEELEEKIKRGRIRKE